jgi:hypothetical protein
VSRPISLTKRVFGRIAFDGNGCWVHTNERTAKGYARLDIGDKHHKAHRLAWELLHGPIPEGMVVCHRCDNPPCVRPDHLWLGSIADNNADMAAKGRRADQRRRAALDASGEAA